MAIPKLLPGHGTALTSSETIAGQRGVSRVAQGEGKIRAQPLGRKAWAQRDGGDLVGEVRLADDGDGNAFFGGAGGEDTELVLVGRGEADQVVGSGAPVGGEPGPLHREFE
jgi:hypothetical protein